MTRRWTIAYAKRRRLSARAASVLLLSFWTWSCGDGAGSAARVGVSAACQDFAACGGEIDGSWVLDGICVDDARAQFQPVVRNSPDCADFLRSHEASASGGMSFTRTGEISAQLSIHHEFALRLNSRCASVVIGQSVTLSASDCRDIADGLATELGYDDVACSFEQGGCSCHIEGSLNVDWRGRYSELATSLVDLETRRSYPFCVEAQTLSIAKVSVGGAMTATLALMRRD
jgi:hypothetical protein